jgi:hypothetical protein
VPGEWQRPRFYGQPSDHDRLEWSWVERQLLNSGIYWAVAGSDGQPHPRPVWGLWQASRLHLSMGTPAIRRALAVDPRVTVHLESGTDVVIPEGKADRPCIDNRIIAAYGQKYDWSYDVAEYGPLTAISPATVLAWQAAGWAGRESFLRSGRWEFAE